MPRWLEAGVVSSAKKKVSGSQVASELGAEVNGDLATLGLSTVKLVKLVQSTDWMISQQVVSAQSGTDSGWSLGICTSI